MEPWQIITIIVVIGLVGVAAYALLRKKGEKRPPVDTDRIRAEKEEKRKPPKKVEDKKKEKVVVKEKEQAPPEAEDEEDKVEEVAQKAEGEDEKAPEEEAAKEEPVEEEKPKKKKKPLLERILPIRKGLKKTRGGFIVKLKRLLRGKREISTELLSQIEELLITSDVGVRTTDKFITLLKDNLSNKELSEEDQVWSFIRQEAAGILSLAYEEPAVEKGDAYTIMVVGVNGAGKTTTIGKLAGRYRQDGKKVLMAAADTFRAAAVSQLEIWGKRAQCDVVKGKESADPSSVVFDALDKAKQVEADIVIADTAGRLHTKRPLMDELQKIKRVMGKAQKGAPHEVLLVLDATTGQNGVAQAKSFFKSLEITGIVLTKLDGTAKGGVILSICNEMNIPIRYIGIGEGVEDLKDFNPEEFVAALFDEVSQEELAA